MATPLSDILQSDIESELNANSDYNSLSAAQKLQVSNTCQQIIANWRKTASKTDYRESTLSNPVAPVYTGDPKYVIIPSMVAGHGISTTLGYTTADNAVVYGRRVFIPQSIVSTKIVVLWSGSVGGTGTRDIWFGLYNSLGTAKLTSAKITLAGASNYNEATLEYSLTGGYYCMTYALMLSGTASITLRVQQVDSVGQGMNLQTVKNYFVSDQVATSLAMPDTLGIMTDPSNNQSKSIPWFILFE